MSKNNGSFVRCEVCGKKLIKRLPNGIWHFKFGRYNDDSREAPVDMLIHGNIQIKCLQRQCGHVNTLNYYPFGALRRDDE